MDDGIGDLDDFEPPHASQSSKIPFILLSLCPLTVSLARLDFQWCKALSYIGRKENVSAIITTFLT